MNVSPLQLLSALMLSLLSVPATIAQSLMRGYYEGRPIYTDQAYYLIKNENGDIDDLFLHRFSSSGGQGITSISISPPLPGRPQFRLSPRSLPTPQGNRVWLMGTADTVYARRYTADLIPDTSFGRDGWAVLGKSKETPSVDMFNWGLSLSDGGGFVAGEYLYRFDASGRPVAPADPSRQCPSGDAHTSIALSGGRLLYACDGRIRRYLPEGRRDSTFNGGRDIVLPRPDGFSAPFFTLHEDTTRRRILVNLPFGPSREGYGPARLLAFNERGEPDSTFNGTGVRLHKTSMRVRGGTLVGTDFSLHSIGRGHHLLVAVTEQGPVVARLRPDGTLDEAYAGASEAERGTDAPGFRYVGSGPLFGERTTSVYLRDATLVVHRARRINRVGACCDYESAASGFGGMPVAASTPPVATEGGSGLRLSSPVPHPVGAGARARLVVSGAAVGERVEAALVDALGRRVAGLVVGGDGAVEVETAGLPAGLYAVRVAGERSGAAVRVLVVAR